jgi:hypothetical protein
MSPKNRKPPDRPDQLVALNVRDFPEDLRWACTAKAALRREDLREFVIGVLREATSDVRLS